MGESRKEYVEKFYLSRIYSKDDLRSLFIERWNWDFPAMKEFYPDLSEEIKPNVKNAEILVEKSQHRVVIFEIVNLEDPERKLKSLERKIVTSSDIRRLIDSSIFIFAAEDFEYIDFVKAEKIGSRIQLKRFSITPENRDKLRTPCEQLENLNVLGKGTSFSDIERCIDEAFSVEAVTKKFYEGYIDIFQKVKKSLIRQKVKPVENKDKKLIEFTHQILNRIMFLYFVQKRGCFGGNRNFLRDFWDKYKSRFKGENKFHKEWLNVLFFEALCNPPWLYTERKHLEEFNDVLKYAPYLNGGLFEKNDLDGIGWTIPDNVFDDIFEFFESFNFTVEESTPLDIDIAINPEMLGNIYEHLINIEEREEKKGMGIYYTPKIEIELMIKRALVEFLYGKTEISKEKIYRFIFNEEGKVKDILNESEARKILDELGEIIILDPACGSGHYLVVATQILYRLKESLWEYLGKKHLSKYEEKKKIIEKNIYGNDIKYWATEIAKLRLWLELFVDADIEKLRNYSEPLLPNLKFKIRVGDSIVQRIGNEIIPLRRLKDVLGRRKEDLKVLIKKKQYVYESGDTEEYKKTVILEKKILQNALNDFDILLRKKMQERNNELRKVQLNLFEQKLTPEQKSLFEKKIREELKVMEKELEKIRKVKEELGKLKEPPMIWDLAFAEVFAKKNGFDIVIANPPYVKHKRIEDLVGFYSKTEYKEKLIEQTRTDWSYDYDGKLRYNPDSSTHPIPKNFDRNSDLYVYFYLKGLKLLNKDGILCYISSNSWLDVGFGAKMQEILLKNVPIVAIYDSVKRTFKQADINTIIALMKAPRIKEQKKEIEDNVVRFVMFRKPYKEIMDPKVFIDIEKNDNLVLLIEGKMRRTDIYRLHVATQNELLEYGKDEKGKYEGNKWGKKYLKAPEIYWKIMEKGKSKLVMLRELIKEIKRGYSMGGEKYFYLFDLGESEKNKMLRKCKNNLGWEGEIEDKFLFPLFERTSQVNSLSFDPAELDKKIFICDVPKKELKNTYALKYIKWCEMNGFHGKWNIKRKKGKILMLRASADRQAVYYSKKEEVDHDQTFYSICPLPEIDEEALISVLNSTLVNYLFREVESGAGTELGQGSLWTAVYEAKRLYVLDLHRLDKRVISQIKKIWEKLSARESKSVFEELGFDPSNPIRKQEPNPLPDRKALDDIIFDALGLTEEERKEVYWAVAELVKQRLEKARSV